jgi:hypothetical protein
LRIALVPKVRKTSLNFGSRCTQMHTVFGQFRGLLSRKNTGYVEEAVALKDL